MRIEDIEIGELIETKNGKAEIIEFLGKGKSGYSYLIKNENKDYVLKIMHDEHCPYYTFGNTNKVVLEVRAYHKLRNYGFSIPALIEFDPGKNYLIKEYIEGSTAMESIAQNLLTENIVEQLFEMSKLAEQNLINIDYFPNNFVIKKEKLFYIDYELNPYSEEWNLENWGIYYWANNDGLKEYLSNGNLLAINENPNSGIPKKNNLQPKIDFWIKEFGEKIESAN